jgi:hypothetical protein
MLQPRPPLNQLLCQPRFILLFVLHLALDATLVLHDRARNLPDLAVDHRRRASSSSPVSCSLPPLPLFRVPWSSSHCRVGAPKDGEPPDAHLIAGQAATAGCAMLAVCTRRTPRACPGHEHGCARGLAARHVGRRQATPSHCWLGPVGCVCTMRSGTSWITAQRPEFEWKSFSNFL